MILTAIQRRPLKAILKQQFISITETNGTTATNWLEKYKWKLEDAMNAYLSSGGRNDNVDSFDEQSLKNINPKLVKLYEKYQDEKNPEIIDIDGTIAYLEDLQIDPEDILSLILAYLLESPSTGIFTKKAFMTIWSSKKLSSLPEMKQYLQSLQHEIDEDLKKFELLYKFTFGFIKANEIDKTISYDLATSYWQLLFKDRIFFEQSQTRLEQWYNFVNEEYKRNFSRDSWNMFYHFLVDIITKDPINFKDYDEMSAWPSVIDEYVEYLRESGLLEERLQ